MYGPFEEETVADLSVNVIPIGIVLFFIGLIFLVNPWEWDPYVMFIVFVLHALPILGLLLISYTSGVVIQRDETGKDAEGEAAAVAPRDESQP